MHRAHGAQQLDVLRRTLGVCGFHCLAQTEYTAPTIPTHRCTLKDLIIIRQNFNKRSISDTVGHHPLPAGH